MNSGRYVIAQVLDLIHCQSLDRLAERYNIRSRHFGCRQQLICMGFAQLIWRESFRDIEECLNAKGPAVLNRSRWQIELLMPLCSTLWATYGSLFDRLSDPSTSSSSVCFGRFLRWIQQHLRIKHFFGTSPNAVKTQVWIAVSIYALIAILHTELKLPCSLRRTLQIVSVYSFAKGPLHELLTESLDNFIKTHNTNQLWLW